MRAEYIGRASGRGPEDTELLKLLRRVSGLRVRQPESVGARYVGLVGNVAAARAQAIQPFHHPAAGGAHTSGSSQRARVSLGRIKFAVTFETGRKLGSMRAFFSSTVAAPVFRSVSS